MLYHYDLPGWPRGQGHRLRKVLVKVLAKVFRNSCLLNMLMDQAGTLYVGIYWSDVLCCTNTIHLVDIEVKVTDLESFISIFLLNMLMDQVDTFHIG